MRDTAAGHFPSAFPSPGVGVKNVAGSGIIGLHQRLTTTLTNYYFIATFFSASPRHQTFKKRAIGGDVATDVVLHDAGAATGFPIGKGCATESWQLQNVGEKAPG